MTGNNSGIKNLQRGQKRGVKLAKSKATPAKRKFAIEYAKTDNGAEAVRRAFPELAKTSSVQYLSTKASDLLKNPEIASQVEYQKQKLELLATKAVDRVEQLIQSDNEMVATTNSWKAIEQVQGKATQRNINLNASITLEDMLNNLQ